MGSWSLHWDGLRVWEVIWLGASTLSVAAVLRDRGSLNTWLRVFVAFLGVTLVVSAHEWWPAWVGLGCVVVAGWMRPQAQQDGAMHRMVLHDLAGIFFLVMGSWLPAGEFAWGLMTLGALLWARTFPFLGWITSALEIKPGPGILLRHFYPMAALLAWHRLVAQLQPEYLAIEALAWVWLGSAALTAVIAVLQTDTTRGWVMAQRVWAAFACALIWKVGAADALRSWLPAASALALILSVLSYAEGTTSRNGPRGAFVALAWIVGAGLGTQSAVFYTHELDVHWWVVFGFVPLCLAKHGRGFWSKGFHAMPAHAWVAGVLMWAASWQPLMGWIEENVLKMALTPFPWERVAQQGLPVLVGGVVLGLLLPQQSLRIFGKWFLDRDPMDAAIEAIVATLRRASWWLQGRGHAKARKLLRLERLRSAARWIEQHEGGSTRHLAKWSSGVLRAGGMALQSIQSGNLQWYLFFAIGSGVAMLLHFLKLGTA